MVNSELRKPSWRCAVIPSPSLSSWAQRRISLWVLRVNSARNLALRRAKRQTKIRARFLASLGMTPQY